MKLLDLFCGAGGAAMGYHQAGFDEIVGIDIMPQPNYPFEFIQADALEYDPIAGMDLLTFDLIHASPPCQAYTTMNNRHGRSSYAVIPQTRVFVETHFSSPYVIENVAGAKSHLINPIRLTGEMFGLKVHRPRLFELGRWWFLTPSHPTRQADPVAVYGANDQRRLWTRKDGSELRAATLDESREAMGIDWMTWDEIREAIPPAYTRYIGEQFLSQKVCR